MTICRAPDTAKIKQKMLYASSKDALRKKLVGIATEIQATDLSEIAYDVVLDKVSKQVSV
jgi:cofilin